jgi:hypothetical protein
MLTADHLLQAFEAAGAEGRLVYVSVPITSGRRELALMAELGCTTSEQLRSLHRDRWRAEVLSANEAEAAILADAVRQASPPRAVVVDPSRMYVSGWEQDDYNGFWVRLVDRFAQRLIATPDWAFSKGARQEVTYAVSRKIEVSDVSYRPLLTDELLEADQNARTTLSKWGLPEAVIGRYLPPLHFTDPLVPKPTAASSVFEWLIRERHYQLTKFGHDQDDAHTIEGLGEDSWWWQQLLSYYTRARVLGLDIPVGRQAIAKFAATACGLLESIVRAYGPLPPPGVPSGNVSTEAEDPSQIT